MRALYPAFAFSFGVYALIAAAVLASPFWLAVGAVLIACALVDLMRMVGISFRHPVGYALECLAWFAMWLVLSAADPFRPKQDD